MATQDSQDDQVHQDHLEMMADIVRAPEVRSIHHLQPDLHP